MTEALRLAGRAEVHGEVPVGAVLVMGDQIIGCGWNRPISTSDPSAHAEIIALRQAATDLKNYRLNDTTLYVTLEPCIMCAGAMIHARIQRVVYGAAEPKTGAVESLYQLLSDTRLNHQVNLQGGVLADACSEQMKIFFKQRRKK